jgi:membrane protease YdiL (CAAX protease family)
MLEFAIAALLALVLLGLLAAAGRLDVVLAEMPTRIRRLAALFMLWAVLVACVFYPTVSPGDAAHIDPETIWFPTIFTGQVILAGFLLIWWLLASPVPLRRFLCLEGASADDAWFGLGVGAVGWAAAIASSAAVALVLYLAGYDATTAADGEPFQIPAVLLWLTALPVWRKLIVVAVAMTVEEAFYRAFLQIRLGWVLSSVLFALSHGGYGLPTLTASVLAVSLAIGWALQRRGNLLPCIVAHGVFDAVQLLIVVPIAVDHLR